ncbi:MAG: hypothetical protein ACQKBY_00095 [Verrucomicrobiales bacterium]
MKMRLLMMLWLATCLPGWTQENAREGGWVVIEATGLEREAPLFYGTELVSEVSLGVAEVRERVRVDFRILQGKAKRLAVAWSGGAEVVSVAGERVAGWGVVERGGERFLEFELKEDGARKDSGQDAHSTEAFERVEAVVELRRKLTDLPTRQALSSFGPANGAGFSARYRLRAEEGVVFELLKAEGLVEAEEGDELVALGASSLEVELRRVGAGARGLELSQVSLSGEMLETGEVGRFWWRGVVTVTGEVPRRLAFLRGEAAPIGRAAAEGYRLDLGAEGYDLVFEEAGVYALELPFVAKAGESPSGRALRFQVPGGAVVPLQLEGLDEVREFAGESAALLRREDGAWRGFLPASGELALAWDEGAEAERGDLFFTTESAVDLLAGSGLIRQEEKLAVTVLQGEIAELELALAGAGEILAVEGVRHWTVRGEGAERVLALGFGEARKGTFQIVVRSQTTLDEVPGVAEPMRLTPLRALRHSGHLRVLSLGAVKVEARELSGLMQLAPEQSPQVGKVPEGTRQVFYYRYPTGERAFSLGVAQVRPEVGLSQILIFEMGESERTLRGELELEIREAGIRDFDIDIPADYQVVAVTGAEVDDYLVGEAEDGRRLLRVLFREEISGRRLVSFHLEKNGSASGGNWLLPVPRYPGAKSWRGQIGVATVPGFRLDGAEVTGLAEIPLAQFQRKRADLQQAYRLRGGEWSAQLAVEALGRHVQADAFHLYALKDGRAYVSVLVNYFVTGSPVDEWRLQLPAGARNVKVEGREVRDAQVEGKSLRVPLHRAVMGAYQLLVSYEEEAGEELHFGALLPEGVEDERGYVQLVSPAQVGIGEVRAEGVLRLDPLELPAEYRLMSHAPSLAAWQYARRPFSLQGSLRWHEAVPMARQVVEFCELESRIARDGSVVTTGDFALRTTGERALRLLVPEGLDVWEVLVNGRQVTTREDEGGRLVPLPAGGRDEQEPVRVLVRAGQEARGERVALKEPRVAGGTQLLTRWEIQADEGRVLKPLASGVMRWAEGTEVRSGADWIGAKLGWGVLLLALLFGLGLWLWWRGGWGGLFGLAILLLLSVIFARLALLGFGNEANLQDRLELRVAALADERALEAVVAQGTEKKLAFSGGAVTLLVLGGGLLVWSRLIAKGRGRVAAAGGFLALLGLLCLVSGAGWFFALWTLGGLWALGRGWREGGGRWLRDKIGGGKAGEAVVSSLVLLVMTAASGPLDAREPGVKGAVKEKVKKVVALPERKAAEEWHEIWELGEERIRVKGEVSLVAEAGEEVLLLRGPAVLTSVAAPGLRVVKKEEAGGWSYLLVAETAGRHEAAFVYELARAQGEKGGVTVPSGPAAVKSLRVLSGDQALTVRSPQALWREEIAAGETRLWLGRDAQARVTWEEGEERVAAGEERFFVEGAALLVPGPGVVDAWQRFLIRPAKGKVAELRLLVPEEFMVGRVEAEGLRDWRFDAGKRELVLRFREARAEVFAVWVESQRALSGLPADLGVAPLRVRGAAGEVGVLAVAPGGEAELGRVEVAGMTPVAAGDFPSELLEKAHSAGELRRVWRYGAEEAKLDLRVVAVEPEVRVTSEEVLSLGEERVVLGAKWRVAITRAGIFQLKCRLPAGYEVESLTGEALSHWTESQEEGERVLVLHLKGKTSGEVAFALSLAGSAPAMPSDDWAVPRVRVEGAARQSGTLVIVPGRGVQVREVGREDVSALDPRELGGREAGSLAYRLLQGGGALSLAVTRQDPWVTGAVLQEVTLREELRKTRVDLQLEVERASVRSLRLRLPELAEADARTVRASGAEVMDLQPIADEPGMWELSFKRRVLGSLAVRVEFEESGVSEGGMRLVPVEVPELRQSERFLALRPGLRLEAELSEARGWREADWLSVPEELRPVDRPEAPQLCLRAGSGAGELALVLRRHEVAESLRLRVVSGELRTLLSTGGEAVHEADLRLEVRQAGDLRFHLPEAGRLLGVFVNEESAVVVRDGEAYLWQVKGDAGGESARVRVFYRTPLEMARGRLALEAFRVDLPMEDIRWLVNVPEGFELARSEGDLDLREERGGGGFDGESYRSLISKEKSQRESEARARLDRVSGYLRQGEQEKAVQTLGQVSNAFALDAASNEDARVQLEALQMRQAVIGLNTRRQRLYFDNRSQLQAGVVNEQVLEAAGENPVFQGKAGFRQDEYGRLLTGNSAEENRVLREIASTWVRHQQASAPAPRLLKPVLPETGRVLEYHRAIQVDGEQALELELWFAEEKKGGGGGLWWALLLALLGLAGWAGLRWSRGS